MKIKGYIGSKEVILKYLSGIEIYFSLVETCYYKHEIEIDLNDSKHIIKETITNIPNVMTIKKKWTEIVV